MPAEQMPLPRDLEPAVFALVDSIVDSAHGSLVDGLLAPTSALATVRVRSIDRSFNCLKAIRLLTEQGYWEFGLSTCRQLLETILNLEEIDRSDDPESRAGRLMRFAALERIRHQLAKREYDLARGRRPPADAERMNQVRRDMESRFPEFLRTGKKGRVSRRDGRAQFVDSWAGKTTWQLAQDGEAIRMAQYNLLFRPASSEAHASPAALFGPAASVAIDGPTGVGLAAPDPDEYLSSERYETRNCLMMASILFCDVARLTSSVHELMTEANAWAAEATRLLYEAAADGQGPTAGAGT